MGFGPLGQARRYKNFIVVISRCGSNNSGSKGVIEGLAKMQRQTQVDAAVELVAYLELGVFLIEQILYHEGDLGLCGSLQNAFAETGIETLVAVYL